MLDIGWMELLVVGALALIVVGPRDLPHLLRTVGQTVGKVKRMAREFQRSMEDAAREADVANFKELRDLKKDIGGLDIRKQAAKAQSYMNQPVKSEKGKAAATGAAASAAAADQAKTPETPAPGHAAEHRPAETDTQGPGPETPQPRQAGAKG